MNTSDPVYFLLVDDMEENLLALEALLRREGLVLLKARSGPEALEFLLIHDVALALVDVQMPGMDGFELAELVRGTDRTRRVPIIFLTAGSPDPQRRFRGYEAGAVDFIRKPIEPDVLRSKAEVFFELYRQRQEVARQRDELRAATDENARLLEQSRRHAEALHEADRRKDEFLATLAHELRNPLAPIRSAVEVMRSKGLNDPSLEWARDVINRQAGNMARLVDELLDVSRIATGKLVLRREPTQLQTIIARAIESSRNLIEANQHRLEVVLPDDPVRLEVDEIRLIQVFSNLLNNAAKYTEPGGQIRLRGQVDDGQVEVRIEDSGVGIPQDMLSHVFGLFTQVGRSLDRAQGGLGVGLALVRRIVELHGGTVTAESPGLNRGSTFTVRFPVAPTNLAGLAAGTASAVPASVRQQPRRRVLVVDDNVDAAKSLAMLLQLMGHATETAYSGPTGLAAAREFHPDVIILDIGLPGMDGYEVARRLRCEPGLSTTLLVALTGWGTEEDKRRAIHAGFDYHLTKPADAETITEILAKPAREGK
jgi:signal transduction histidine kinase